MVLRPRVRLGGGLIVLCLLAVTACGGAGGAGSDATGSVKNAAPAPTGAVATKMQPQLDGWAFPNFPSATFPDINFDTADLVSMFGTGADVCVDGVAEPCTLTAEAAAWARMVNQARATGHCEGLVALASARFNSAQLPETVKLPSEEDEVRALMRAFATQFVPEVQSAIEKWTRASLAEKVDELKRSLASDTLEYTLGVYVEGGGHAILPYAVEYPAPDVARIMVYDSNWPGRNRYVDVDLNAEKWTFSFAGDDPSADPNAWTGGAGDMDLTPFEAREGSCPFCGDGTKLQTTTLLVRSENLDWSVDTDAGSVSPSSPTSGDGASARPVKGDVSIVRMAAPAGGRSSYDYVITIPNNLLEDGSSADTTSSTVTTQKKKRAKLNFGGASSVFAVMQSGVAQFTTPGGDQSAPVELGTTSIKSNDPNVDLTLAAGNLVANASGSSVELGSTGGTLEVAVTTATGEVIQQEVTPEAPAVQVKADESGAVTVLQASATGEVKKTEVAADGTKTETVVDASELNLNKVEVELPAALVSKPIESLPKLEDRNLNNPNYKADEAYVPPTTVAAPASTAARGESQTTLQTRNGALPTTTTPRSVTAAGATPTTIATLVKPTVANFRIATKTFGDDAFTLDAPESDSPAGFRYTSSRPEVATVGSTTGRVTIVGAGSTTITATQGAARGFEAATISATLTVAKAKPTIAAIKDVTKTFGDDPFTFKDPASDSSGAITYSSSNEDVIRKSKTTGRWIVVGAGRSTITVTQASTDDYLAGTDSFIVTVRKGTPTIEAPADVSKSFLDAEFDLPKPVSSSKGAFTYASSDSSVVSITGSKASIKSSGTVTITAAQASTDDWLGASATFKIAVSTTVPTLTEFADVAKTFGDASFTLVPPKSNSAGAITYKSSDEKIVTVGESTGKVTVVGAGTATITAAQAASGGFGSGSISAKVTIAKAEPTVSDLIVADKEFGDPDFTLKPTTTGTGKFTFSTDKADIFGVDAESGAVKIVGVGTATLTAKVSSTANYEAGAVSASVTVKKGTPTLTWTAISKTYGDAPFDLASPASRSTGKFTYSISSADAVVASVSEGGRVTINKAGTVTITAKQASTSNWNEASTTATLTIDKATPNLGTFIIPVKTYGDADFALAAPTSNSPVAFDFGVVAGSSGSDVAVVSADGHVSLGMAGSVTIRAKQDANENFTSASITATLTLERASQLSNASPTFGFTPTSVIVATPTTLSIVGGAGTGAVTYSVVDAGATGCTVSAGQRADDWSINATSVGTCTVQAMKAGDRNYLSVESAVTDVSVVAAQLVSPSPAVVDWYTADEGGTITMSAPTGQVVTSVDFASYGTPTGSSGNFALGSCHSSSSQLKVEQALLGKNSGTIAASNAVFGDPCGGTYKRLYVKVTFGEGISRQGLISYLDATKVSSYPGSGTSWTDLSGNNNNANLVGVTYVSAGYMNFTGSAYADWGQPLETGSSYTIDAWVWRNSTAGNQNIASTNQSPFWFAGGPLCAGVAGSYTIACYSNSTTNSWMHVAVTFDDATDSMRLYANGTLVDSRTATQTFVKQWLTIGAHNNGASAMSNLQGRIAEIRLYNRALTASEIQQNYSAASR